MGKGARRVLLTASRNVLRERTKCCKVLTSNQLSARCPAPSPPPGLQKSGQLMHQSHIGHASVIGRTSTTNQSYTSHASFKHQSCISCASATHQSRISYTVLHQWHISHSSVVHLSLISCASVTHQSLISCASVMHQLCISYTSVMHQSCISHNQSCISHSWVVHQSHTRVKYQTARQSSPCGLMEWSTGEKKAAIISNTRTDHLETTEPPAGKDQVQRAHSV